MKKYSGDAALRGNLDVLSDKPLDSRLVVLSKSDLYSLDPLYAYNGMPVTCINTGKLYILKNKDLIRLAEGWAEVGGGGGSSDFVILSESEYSLIERYEEDMLYFIYEPWGFGSSFPITFSGWGFGEAFPIKLA